MEQKGLRGSAPARIDEKGRLKVPTQFRADIMEQYGPDLFVTSLTGESVDIYPLPVWLEKERKLLQMPSTDPSRVKYLERVNHFGQGCELDSQGRVVIPAQLRDSASIVGEVRVSGRIDHLSVWNAERLQQRLQREQWTDADAARMAENGI